MSNMMKNSISNVMTYLKDITELQIAYDEKKRQAVNDYRGRMLEDALSLAEAETKNAVDRVVAKMQASFDSLMRETVAANGYDVTSSAVADAAKLLSAPDVNFRTAEAVIKPFIGNQTALNLISANAKSDEVKAAVDAWLFDNTGLIADLKKKANSMSWEPVENYPTVISDIRTGLQKYARLMGVDISDIEATISELKIKNIMHMMGISPDQL